MKGYPEHIRLLKDITDFILIASYHSHSETTLKYLQNALSGINRGLPLFAEFRETNNFSGIPKIHALSHYIKCIREMGSADNSDTECTEEAHSWLIKSAYRSTNKMDLKYVAQMLQWEQRLFNVKSRVSILRHIITAYPDSPKSTVCKLLVDPEPDKSTLRTPQINGLARKRTPLTSLTLP